MLGKQIVLFFGLVVAAALAVAPGKGKSLIIGQHFYFHDTTGNRNRAQAFAFCNGTEGELAKITNTQVYNLLRATVPAGSYWIDGIDKQSSDRFEVSETCSDGALNLDKINVEIPSASCLSLVKGASAALSKIQAVPCTSALRGVICALPLAGCKEPPTTATSPI